MASRPEANLERLLSEGAAGEAGVAMTSLAHDYGYDLVKCKQREVL